MRIFSGLRSSAWLVLGLMIAVSRLAAQSVGYNVSIAPDPVGVSNSTTFTITLTNLLGASEAFSLTNTFSAPVQIGSLTYSQGSTPTTHGNTNVVFPLGTITNNGIATIMMQVTPVSVGFLTNLMTVATNGVYYGVSAPMIAQVTNAISVADLAVAVTGPAVPVFTNDLMVYSVSVTNLGPGNATNVFLTNSLPGGVTYVSVSPSNKTFTVSQQGSNVVFGLGTLTNQAFWNFQLTVLPASAGTLTFLSVVGTNNVLDNNMANNVATATVTVGTFVYDQLIATNLVATNGMTYDPQTGLMKQTVRLTNSSTNDVAAARVIVSGLTNWLYNAVGTNSGNPYVVYNSTLTNNQYVDLVLEYFVPTRLPINVDNSHYTAVGVPVTDLSVSGGTNGTFSITLMTNLPNGNVLIEFESVLSSNYTVLYGGDLSSITQAAQPSIVAPANRTQWIDDGPPKTVSHPTNSGTRFYRVRLNP